MHGAPRSSMLRLGGAFVVGSLVVTGCLFPSFEKFESADGPEGANGGKDGGKDGAASDSAAPADGGEPADASSDGPPAREILCGPERCALPAENCCTTIGGPDCQPPGATFCTSVQGGQLFECDGDEDCGEGQTCCYVAADKTAKCQGTCAGQALCNGPARRCPTGKTCAGTVEIFRACQ